MVKAKSIRGYGDGTCEFCKSPTPQVRGGYRRFCHDSCRAKFYRLKSRTEFPAKSKDLRKLDNLLTLLETSPIHLERLKNILNIMPKSTFEV